ncbi:MAG: hypothetical protein AAF587_27490 [Bacteroidota bacterium]
MSIVLSMYGNHKLTLDSYESGVDEIEQHFNTQIIDYKEGIDLPQQTNHIHALTFWTHHEFYKLKFKERNWGFWLNCNHRDCERIRIFRNSVDFVIRNVNTRYDIWKDLISTQYQTKEKYSDNLEFWEAQDRNWKSFASFAKECIVRIGGNTIIYMNDFAFQDIEAELWQGGRFEEAIENLKKKSEEIEIKELIRDKKNTFEKMENWFIERIIQEDIH